MSIASSGPPVGVQAALLAASDPSFTPQPTLSKEFSLEGRVAIVTGAGRGLGLEMAEALAEAGATVYCLARSASPTETWKATQTYVSKLGLAETARLEYASVDIADQKAIREAIDKISEKEGRLDVCIASAGVKQNITSLDVTTEQFEQVTRINEMGAFYTAQAAAKQMVKHRIRGSIVFIASIAGSTTIRGLPLLPYSASKAALIQMARTLACDLGHHGIRVNSLSPGVFPTEINQQDFDEDPDLLKNFSSSIPLGRVGKPAELRGAITWLASGASSFCTGSNIIIDGGQCSW